MKAIFDKLGAIREANDENTLMSITHELLCGIGLEHFIFAVIEVKGQHVNRHCFAKWPADWFHQFDSLGFSQQNHFVPYVKDNPKGTRLELIPCTTQKHHDLMDMGSEFEINSGAIVGVSPNKEHLGTLYACSSDSKARNNANIDRNLPLLSSISNELYDSMERIKKISFATEMALINPFELSQTHILALMWAAEGLNNEEIAQKLQRQPVSVKKYLETARESLAAKNTSHAIVKAIRHGIIC